jgi:transposase-like protein
MQDKTPERSQKLQMIEAWHQSGLSQKQFCLQNNVTHSTFYYWYRVYKSCQKKTEGFVPLTVTRQTDELMTLTGSSGIRLQLPVSSSAAGFVKQLLLG